MELVLLAHAATIVVAYLFSCQVIFPRIKETIDIGLWRSELAAVNQSIKDEESGETKRLHDLALAEQARQDLIEIKKDPVRYHDWLSKQLSATNGYSLKRTYKGGYIVEKTTKHGKKYYDKRGSQFWSVQYDTEGLSLSDIERIFL